MRIAVIDDEYAGRSELCYLLKQFISNPDLAESDSGKDAIRLFEGRLFDVAFIDMELGDMNGVELAQQLLAIQPTLKIIFATAYDCYAIKAFDIGVIDYVLKPFEPKRMEQCVRKLEKAMAQTVEPETTLLPNKLAVPAKDSMLFINIEDIMFIETENRYCRIHTQKEVYPSNQTLGYYEKKLQGYPFYKTHKSYLVNLEYISEISPWFNGAYILKLRGENSLTIPISRGHMKELKNILKL